VVGIDCTKWEQGTIMHMLKWCGRNWLTLVLVITVGYLWVKVDDVESSADDAQYLADDAQRKGNALTLSQICDKVIKPEQGR